MPYVYVLLCQNNSLYTGVSDDPKKRFVEHLAGKGGKYTRSFKPVKIVYTEKLATKSLALKKELEIKSWSRREKIKILGLKI